MQIPGLPERGANFCGSRSGGPEVWGGASHPIPVLHAWSLDLKEKMTTRGRDTWFRAAPQLGNSENVLGAPDWKSASFSYTVVTMWPEFQDESPGVLERVSPFLLTGLRYFFLLPLESVVVIKGLTLPSFEITVSLRWFF